MFNLTTKNTTVLGVLMILNALSLAGMAVFDGDVATSIDFQATLAQIVAGIALIRVQVVPPPTP